MNAAASEDVFLPCLRTLSLLQGQPEDLVRFLAARGDLICVRKGELVCSKGSQTFGLFCVLNGSVKVAVISHQGNERVMEIVGPGEMFGEASMFLQRPCPVYAEALAKTQLVFFRRGLVIEAIKRSPGLALAMIQGMSRRHVRLIRDVEICCLQPAAERVISFILDHATPSDGGGYDASVPLPAGKAVIASNLNLTPETFSRELHQLVDQGLVDVVKRTIRIHDLDSLRAQLAERKA